MLQSALTPYGFLYLLVHEHPEQEFPAVRALVEHSGLYCYDSHVHETGLDKVEASAAYPTLASQTS